MNKPQKLDSNQLNILKRFITVFLPQRGNKRKGTKNEIEYIGKTIDRIFSKYFNFNVSMKHILDAFEELEYPIFPKKSVRDGVEIFFIKSEKGIYNKFDNVYKAYGAEFIYVDIEPHIVGQLHLVTYGLPPNTSKEKLNEKEEMIKRINLFKQTIKDK